MSRSESDIRTELSFTIQNEPNNYSKILSLSNELSKFDENNIRFTVDAGLIDRLGNELVARQETAVSELVKNAYDADAYEVELLFINSYNIGGTLVISDNGNGMSRDQLIDGFMRISSTDKIQNPLSPRYSRKRAGQKGIGRFAVQRLGAKLTIITQIEDCDTAFKLCIDWDKYERNNDLSSISNKLEILPRQERAGTILVIEKLRDRWTDAAIKRIYRYVADIMQPFPLSKTEVAIQTENNLIVDPGFKTKFLVKTNGNTRKIVDEGTMVYDHATARIDGEIDENGIGTFNVLSDKLRFEFNDQIGLDPDNKNEAFDKLKNVKFRAYYYIYGSDLIPKMHESAIRRLANISGGIRLYRNGFRVLPYGEAGDDWVGLDASTRRRSILPVHANINFFGFVEIDDSSGDFEETSSREGLMSNQSLIQLQNFVYRAILTSMIRIADHRNIKVASGQQKDEYGNWEKMEITVKNIAHSLDELDKALENEDSSVIAKARRKRKVQKLQQDIKEVVELQKQEHVKLFKERSMLRVLSSVGLTVGQFIHEIKYYLDNIKDDVKIIMQDLSDNLNALSRLEILDTNFSIFKTYVSYFDYVISQNIIRELHPIELQAVVRPFVNALASDAAKSGIIFSEPIYQKYGLYTKPMHPSEWASILFNFYTNSRKAIKRVAAVAGVESGKILIECGQEDNIVFLEFSDTGDGISKENEEHIFEEFFTTTSQSSLSELDSSTEILGTGLGLKIVKDIVLSYKGNVKVVSPKGEFSTCIRVEIPKATDNELNEYDV